MASKKRPIKVTSETNSGLNTSFHNPNNNQNLTRGDFVKQISQGKHPDYHVMTMRNKKTGQNMNIPRSNPNNKESDNLG